MIRLFRVFFPTSVVALLFSEIVILLFCYTLASYWLIDVDPTIFLLYDGGLLRISVVILTIILGLHLQDLYTEVRVRSRVLLLQQMCLGMGIAFLGQGLTSYVNPAWVLPRWVMLYGSGLSLVLLTSWRVVYIRLVFRALGVQKVLFVGASWSAQQIAARLAAKPELGFSVAGFVENPDDFPAEIPPQVRLGDLSSLRRVVQEQHPDRIVVGMAERRHRLPVNELLDLRLSGIPISEASTMYEVAFGQVCTRDLRPAHLIFTTELGPSENLLLLQYAYSFLIALVSTILLLPVLALVAAAIKLSSPGPVLFRQKRVGMHGRIFTLYKFRSMYADAEAHTGAVWAARDDPRTTPVGRWLRRLRLDELPQFFNILRGEMSLVGPRPERPEFVNVLTEKIPYYRQRHCVRPGITGWAQINCEYPDSLDDTVTKLEYDLYYIKNLSLALDVYIAFHTFKIMLLSRGSR
jgi:sugar transferase (PEP-CTERM system associated)